ncbi:hypothetical protein [Plantactinospora sp. KBS50]|uniref:hypothetical protein n=1 Tax=Plantactinospora sp. KBS50 TaxID=2024580 RepID=UPI001E379762|nr:hypothetical protein [Plantactinospora sp. KBS50]
MQRVARGAGRGLGPGDLGEPVGGDDLVEFEREDREDESLLAWAEVDADAFDVCLDRAQ